MTRQVVIIGNGIAGITAARHIRKLGDHEITVVSAETDHFFSRTALMYVYMGHMSFEDTKPYEDWFWDKNRIRLMRAYVELVDTAERRLELSGGKRLPYDVLIVASGSRSNKFGWPGQDLRGVQGFYSYPDLQLMEENTEDVRRAVIVGGGLIGVETAEMLRSRDIPVSFLVREQKWMEFAFPAPESEMITRQIRAHGVDLRLSTEIERILPDDHGRVRAVVTKRGEEIACEFVALTVGVSPNVGFLRDSRIECDRGVLVDAHLRTNVAEVYAIGDCAQLRQPLPGRRAVEPVWYVGRRMGETVARTICGEPSAYDQGIWFNSAKFFDLEWQIYGTTAVEPGADVETLHWEHPAGRKSIRIDYRRDDGAVVGFNLIGVRYRHEVCHEWIRDGRSIRFVLQNLGAANFDPELFRQHEQDLIDVYNTGHPEDPVTLRRRRGIGALLAARRVS
jgi:NAD(P)H-nitrite reductase large subunit